MITLLLNVSKLVKIYITSQHLKNIKKSYILYIDFIGEFLPLLDRTVWKLQDGERGTAKDHKLGFELGLPYAHWHLNIPLKFN